MHIKSIAAGAAIALAATVGSASAGDQFTTLGGVTAEPMNAGEMAAVTGEHVIINPIAGPVDPQTPRNSALPPHIEFIEPGVLCFGTICPVHSQR